MLKKAFCDSLPKKENRGKSTIVLSFWLFWKYRFPYNNLECVIISAVVDYTIGF